MGDLRSDLINFGTLGFTTYTAGGVDDFINYKFKEVKFENILKFDGSYVLRFAVENEVWNDDLLDEMYDEETAKLNAMHAPRKNNTLQLDFSTKEEKYDTEQAEALLNEIK